MRRLGLVGWIVWLLVACETPLREPMCSEDEQEFPVGAEGRYTFSLPQLTPEYSGAYAAIVGLEFVIRDLGSEYELEVNEAGRKGLAALAKAYAVKVPNNTPIEITMPLSVCRIGDRYYVNGESEGAYTLQRFDLSPTGITTTGLVWRPEDLERHGFRYYFVPKFVEFSGSFQFDLLEPTKLFVDNRGLTPERREELVNLAQPTASGMVFSRVGPPPPPTERVKGGLRWRFKKAR